MKKSYETPKLSTFGNVADLTTQVGMTFTTDSFGTGSMAFPGQGQGSGNNQAGGGGNPNRR
ncbi:lasso peptide [Nodosilinea sp. P-1105]|uniref:lasso peptide n=1 Tax=Nodosilinea sp. P-1105 TaxID=2546229 RepID=UPI00146E856F|nr:lasso peptide [Nodosilinea sp. P-1105]NMF83050.1 lasso peptide [Nodosilinea sp. P-1105]